MKRCLVIINNTKTGGGGAERRFARCFIHMSKADKNAYLIINSMLYDYLLRSGVSLDKCSNVKVLRDTLGKLSERLAFSSEKEKGWWMKIFEAFLFFIKKTDYFFFIFSVMNFIKREKIDVAHLILGGVYCGFPLLFVGKLKTVISYVALRNMTQSKIGNRLFSIALKRCTTIDTLYSAVKERLARLGINEGKIYVSRCGFTDYDKFYPAKEKKNWVVFAARFVEDKNPLLFVESIPLVLACFPSTVFILLGDGHLKPRILKRIKELDIAFSVRVQFLCDIKEILSFSSIFVSIQKEENYPSQSLLEAMACGNATIATDYGETRKLVDERVGILIKEDVRELADSIIKLLGNSDMAKKMGVCAREKVMKEHNIDTFVGYIDDLYKKTMERI